MIDTEHRDYHLVLRSAWEHDPPDPRVETVSATTWREAIKHASQITDVLLVGMYPVDEEDRLREALGE